MSLGGTPCEPIGASPGLQLAAAPAHRVSLRQANLRRVREGFVIEAISAGDLRITAERSGPGIGEKPVARCQTQKLFFGSQRKRPRKFWSGSSIPKYRAPHQANSMLQSGPLPQHTMSGSLSGAFCFGVLDALVCAAAENKPAVSRRIATQPGNRFLIARDSSCN